MIDKIKNRANCKDVLEFAGIKFTGKGNISCPFHEDKNPSMGLHNNYQKFKCFSCGRAGDCIELYQELFDMDRKTAIRDLSDRLNINHSFKENIETEYVYNNMHGEKYMKVVRLKNKKGFPLYKWNGVKWVIGRPDKLVPYKLDQLSNASKNELVWIVEGEKDVESLNSLGIKATTNSGGGGNFHDDLIPYFENKNIIICSDNDIKGELHKYIVAEKIFNVSKNIRILDIPELEDKEDISDWIKKKRCTTDDKSIIKELNQLLYHGINVDKDYLNKTIKSKINEIKAKISNKGKSNSSCCDTPEDILKDDELSPVKEFDISLLPSGFDYMVKDITERMQVPADFVACALMIALSSLIAYRVNIRPKQKDPWTIVVNLWGVIIGLPSLLKTPSADEALKPLRKIDKKLHEAYEEQLEEYEKISRFQKLRNKANDEEIKRIYKKNKNSIEANNEIQILLEEENIEPPVEYRRIVNDTTIEKLQEIQIVNNGRCLLLERDEITGFIYQLDKSGRESDRKYYLEAWNGSNSYRHDTIGRGSNYIPNNTISIFGTSQPATFRKIIYDTIKSNYKDDGFVQRFQLAVYPDVRQNWELIDRVPDYKAIKKVNQVFEYIENLQPTELNAYEEYGKYYLRFTEEAQEVFNGWFIKHENTLRSKDNDLPAYLISHFSKYRSLLPSLALILHIADMNTGNVNLESVEKAIKWIEYLMSHAFRVYGSLKSPEEETAKLIANKLLSKQLPSIFTIRDLYRKGWSGITKDSALKGLEVLQDAKWGVIGKNDTKGRPSEHFIVNEKIHDIKKSTANTDKTSDVKPFDSIGSPYIIESKNFEPDQELENLLNTPLEGELVG